VSTSTSPTDPRQFTRYDRREHGAPFVSWVYEYWNADVIEKSDGLGAGLELGVQLTGEWLQAGARRAKRSYGPGMIHRIDPGERYALSFTSPHARSVQVGFIVYPEQLGLCAPGEELRFAGDSGARDHELFEFSRSLHASATSDPVLDEEVRGMLLAYVGRHCEKASLDPVLVGRQELERNLDRDLTIEDIADVAGMHPVTFARRFKARFGLTPVHYRLRQRLNHAARLTWSRPDLSIDAVAFDSGFTHLGYFHRSFRRFFGLTPAAYARGARATPSPVAA
jgi:AraC-like DNA-binding protein